MVEIPSLSDVAGFADRLQEDVAAWRGETVPGQNMFEFRGPKTTIQFHGQGLGDMMIIRQFGRAFADYLRTHPDPGLGRVVISCGGYKATFNPAGSDVNCYWWWSFGPKDDTPEEYLDMYLQRVSVDPDVILCLSERCVEHAQDRGYETLYLPLGTYAFRPLGFDRNGLGYAGSKHHKKSPKEEMTVGQVSDRVDFEWVSNFVTPTQLNLWYNTRLATFGITKEGQRQWGMVNNRVFETIASGTPLILESHPTVDDVLGFEYPLQTESAEETRELVDRIETAPQKILSEFDEYATRVREEHSYENRVKTLLTYLSNR